MREVDGVRVLIVEDEAMIAMMAEEMLDAIGYAVAGVAPGLAEAMAAADGDHFDVAMLDVNLNGTSSMDVAARLKARGKPFVFTTGYGSSGVGGDHADAPVVAKPYVSADLKKALDRCADQLAAGTSSTTSSSDSNRG